jgi:predicted MPP superfamily phosphohydrolase
MNADAPHASRRALLSRLFYGGVGMGFASLGYGRLIEPRRLSIERLDIALPHLTMELDGLRVVQLSDLHLEPYTTAADIEAAVLSANALQPDIIVLTGDFITGNNKAMGLCAEVLSKLVAPLGIYASLGNHDVWHGSSIVVKRLRNVGIQTLVNEGVTVQHRGQTLCLAGTDSAWAGRPRLEAAFAKLPKDAPTLLLAHEPDFADTVAAFGRPVLQLAGHSHGGQVRVPVLGSLRTPSWAKKYIMGHYEVGAMQLYVNRGIGCVGLPMRFACPPEITQITLRAKFIA